MRLPENRRLKVSRILHAGYLFESAQTKIVFDPIFESPFSRNCYAFPEVQFDRAQIQNLELQAIFISHFHDDHCCFDSLDLLDRKTPVYIYCLFEELFILFKELGFLNVHSVALNVEIHVGAFTVTPRRALDMEVDCIFQIQAAGFQILNVVDSWISFTTVYELAQKGPWDLILWPFQTLRELQVLSPSRALRADLELPSEWIEQLKILNPRYVVPSSCQFSHETWSWCNQSLFPITYRQFESQVSEALDSTKVIRLNPSVSVEFSSAGLTPAQPLAWVLPIGPQDVDYDYRADLNPPSMSDVARKFLPLSESQARQVTQFIDLGLVEKFKQLEDPAEVFFQSARVWKLRIFDHLGESFDCHYQICGNRIQKLANWVGAISWLTEVAATKLHGALAEGESLTSMYLRINDTRFDSDVEAEIGNVDVLADPLIRVLFANDFGSFQRAQLRRLRSALSIHL